MRLLFAGTPALAVPSLEALAREGWVRAVLTTPDAPAGRGGKLRPSPVKTAAQELGVPLLEPQRLKECEAAFRELGADAVVVVAYRKIFRPWFLSLFPKGGINLHPSLLPRHRGPSPIPATILAGDAQGGVTVQHMAEAVDSGAILGQIAVPLDGTETAATLTDRLAALGASLLVDVFRGLEAGTVVEREQDHTQATYSRKLTKEDGRLDWSQDALTLSRMVRAYDPYPGAFTTWRGTTLKVLESAPLTGGAAGAERGSPGIVLRLDKRYGILVSTGDGVLCLRRLQLEARRALDWQAFWNGVPGFQGTTLGEASNATIVDSAPADT